jgi:PKD repeat protein
MRKMVLFLALAVSAFGSRTNAATLPVASLSGKGGDTVTLDISYASGGVAVATAELTLNYDTAELIFMSSAPGAALIDAGKVLVPSVTDGVLTKLSIYPAAENWNPTIGDGVLVKLTFAIATGVDPGTYPIHVRCLLGDQGVNFDSATCPDGSVIVQNLSQPDLAIGSVGGLAGTQVSVPITLTTSGETVCATANRALYDFNYMDWNDVIPGPAATDAGKIVFYNQNPTTHVITLGVIGFNQNPISDGIVAYVRFTIKPASVGCSAVTNNSPCESADCLGNDLPTTCSDGQVCMQGPCTVTCSGTATPSSGPAPLGVAFTGAATTANCFGTPSYSWTFGDGGSSVAQSPSYTYSTPGFYTWNLTVTTDGVSSTASGVVSACGFTCSASAAPASGQAPLAVTFTGTSTPVGCIGAPSYSWIFGDGGTSNLQNAVHAYAAGTYTWTMTVTVDGMSCSQSGTIEVAAYNLNFFDDLGRARLCVNSTAGAWRWQILQGPGMGVYEGVGRVAVQNGVLLLTSNPGEPWALSVKFYERQRKASGSFNYRSKRIASVLVDSNTANNTMGCP